MNWFLHTTPPAIINSKSINSEEFYYDIYNSKNKGFFVLVRFIQSISYVLVSVLKIFVRTEVIGGEVLKKYTRNVIFASSHISEIDILLIPSTFGFFSKHFPIRFFTFESKFYKTEIAKDNVFKKFFYGGWLFRICGSCEFNRKLKHLDYKEKLKDHIFLLKNLKHSLLIFPEGSFEYSGRVNKVLPGTPVLSYYSGAPVIPVYATLSNKITLKNLLFFNVKLKVVYGEALTYQEMFKKDFKDSIENTEITEEEIEFASNLILKKIKNCYDKS